MNNEAKQARSEFQAVNSGVDKTLVSVDKRIRVLTAIFEGARDDYASQKDGFKPGYDRQSHEIHLGAMNRDIKKIQAARDELAELLGP